MADAVGSKPSGEESMCSAWTLPLIEAELDGLPQDCDFILTRDDSERLFGAGDASARRAADFALGHGCRAAFRQDELIFRKLPGAGRPAPLADPLSVECFPPVGPSPRSQDDDHPGQDCR